jgi:uncharacterized protein
MRRLVARNASLNTVIADRVDVASTHAERAVGLLKRSGLEPGEGLWIVPSRGVHTCWMRFTIDVLALDEAGTVADAPPAQGHRRRAGTSSGDARSLAHEPRASRGARDGFPGVDAMTPLALVAEKLETRTHPMPPSPPATIAETGLHPDTLAQLMLKTLVAGEASGTQLAERMRLPFSVLDAMIQHARVE